MNPPATILYIEDDAASRALLLRVLAEAGHHVTAAGTGREGMDLAHRLRPDLILLDLHLPDIGGRDVAVRLHAEPRLAAVPIVVLTAYPVTGQDEAFAESVAGCMVKPVDLPALTQRIEEYLGGRRDPLDDGRTAPEDPLKRLESTVHELATANRELRRLDYLKDDFIQLTAHELRTPLTTVYGYSRLVQTCEPILALMEQDDDVKACVEGLADSVDRLQLVINEIITVSRIASGRVDLRLGPANLGEIVRSTVSDYRQVIQQRKLQVSYEAREWPAQFYADAALLELAFSNILGNAIKYTPDGGAIALHARRQDDTVLISFRDTGIGIDPQDQPYIFDRFYTAGDTQLHSTSKTAFRGGGLGLGLAISRGIVEAHWGRIWVESSGHDPARCPGSTFWITLPLTGQPQR